MTLRQKRNSMIRLWDAMNPEPAFDLKWVEWSKARREYVEYVKQVTMEVK